VTATPDASFVSGAVLEETIAHVRSRIEAACGRASRDPRGVTLVAVTKTVPLPVVIRARGLGLEQFGENYVNELRDKRDRVPGATWHYVGTLQSHTAHRVADLADVVHSLAPGGAAMKLAARAVAVGKRIPALVQVDLASRGTGVAPEGLEDFLHQVVGLEGTLVIGLMTLPPEPESPQDSRPHFRRLRELRDRVRDRFEGVKELSMGMSLDYEIAVEEGATILRVGTALFGRRPPKT
jgi:pyridoxal phosphate enzyme (YggS family)